MKDKQVDFEKEANRFKAAVNNEDYQEVKLAQYHIELAVEQIRQAERHLNGVSIPVFKGMDTVNGCLSVAIIGLNARPPIG